MNISRRQALAFGTVALCTGPLSAQPTRRFSDWSNARTSRPEGYELDLRETGAAFDGRTDDTAAIQDGINWIAEKGGGTCRLPSRIAQVATLNVPASVILEGAGGHTGATVLRGIAQSGPVVRLTGRSAGLRGVQIASTPDRLSSRMRDAHGIHATRGDVAYASAAAASLSRLSIEDVYVINQPVDGIHVSAPIEHSLFDTVTVADCKRHGFALDDGTRARYANKTYPFFVLMMTRCRALECAGNALLAGVPGQTHQPHNLILDQFEALGCCWDENAREIVQQIGLYNQQTIMRQPDIEDQQYRQTATASTAMPRMPRTAPAEGILCASQGVDIQQPYFSSLARSVVVHPRVTNIRITQPRIYAGAWGSKQPVAIAIGREVVEFEVIGTTQQGAVELVRSESALGIVRVDGVAVSLPRT